MRDDLRMNLRTRSNLNEKDNIRKKEVIMSEEKQQETSQEEYDRKYKPKLTGYEKERRDMILDKARLEREIREEKWQEKHKDDEPVDPRSSCWYD